MTPLGQPGGSAEAAEGRAGAAGSEVALWHAIFNNPDRVLLEDTDKDEVRLWSRIQIARFYRPHMLLQPVGGVELFYVVDATHFYLTLLELRDGRLEMEFSALREYVLTTGVGQYWVASGTGPSRGRGVHVASISIWCRQARYQIGIL